MFITKLNSQIEQLINGYSSTQKELLFFFFALVIDCEVVNFLSEQFHTNTTKQSL